MKKLIAYIILLFVIRFVNAQNIQVLDATTLQPINNVSITDSESKNQTYTNNKGYAVLWQGANILIISHPDYHKKNISANDISDNKIYLQPQTIRLDEVVISANRFEEKRTDVAQKIEVISAKDLQNMSQQNMADVLQQTGQVLVQKSQQGGGSPIIRGFEASRVLLVVDGIRLNTAIFRTGHLQNILRIDNNILDRTEIVFGPASTLYGSDALGGVVHMHTRKPVFSTDDKTYLSGGSYLRFSSANTEKTAHANVSVGFKKLAFVTGITYSDFGDLIQGKNANPFVGNIWLRPDYVEPNNSDYTKDSLYINSNPFKQVKSGYKQYDVLQKIAFKQNDFITHTLNFQFSNTSDVPRYDRLAQRQGAGLRFAEWYYGPEKRLLAAYHLTISKESKLFDKMNLTLAYQNIDESRITRRFRNRNRFSQIENVNLYSFNLDLMKASGKHEIRYGAEFTHNIVASKAIKKDLSTGVETPDKTRYPDGGSTFTTAALFASHTWEINDKLILTDGIRFNYVNLDAKFQDTAIMKFPFSEASQTNQAITGSLGIIFKPVNSWRISLIGSTGFRSPNVDDLGKVFDSQPGRVIVPNNNIKPEYTYNIDLGIEKTFTDKLKINVTGFYTHVTNLITDKPFKYNDQDSIIYQGILSEVRANQNVNKAYITGTSLALYADLNDVFSFTSGVNVTYARITSDTIPIPLDHIPPVYGKTSFIVNLKKFRGEFFVLYNGWKYLGDYSTSGEDNLNQATPLGMPAWYTLNLRTSYQITKFVRMQFSVENILDYQYRVFASGISAPGRNFMITLRASF